ncbi:MAG TPA: LysR family transcriptional regulator [Candidatus Limnocylindrales bacterium]|jgi:DNA-binding transcriptional LysR family regulator|nr:LysR family transcriptional regulator [Candidatus Limnocylindrales bacterium]
MLLSQVEAFLETARHRNLSRAADALHVTQPALTARLQALEGELKTSLFVRGRRGMALTDDGRAFLPYAERAVVALDAGANLLSELRHGGTGELVLGAAPAVSTYVLPGLLVRFSERHPKVRLVVRTGHSEEILEMAVRREIDLGLTRELYHPDIEQRPLYEDELVLVTAGSHAFAERSTVGLRELAAARLILFDRTSSYYDLTNAFFREAGVAPNGVMELDNIDAAKQMVGAGLGVALLPHASVAAEIADGRLRAIDIEGATPIRRPIVVIRRRDLGPATGPVAAFLEGLAAIDAIVPGGATRRP